MSVYTHFNPDLILELNKNFRQEENRFVMRDPYPELLDFENCIVDNNAFNINFINAHASEYKRIFLHFNYLKPHQIMQLSDEAARKIVWVVWGDDLYYVKHRYGTPESFRDCLRKYFYIWSHYSLLYGLVRQKARKKIRKFYGIGIGFPFDELMVRRLYGNRVSVFFAPVFSNGIRDGLLEQNREEHLRRKDNKVNVLIGHSGFPFHDHEKSLRLLSKYHEENIHINMVLSYGANEARIKKLTEMAHKIYGKEKVTIHTEMLPYQDYCSFLAQMDVALFPFIHQSALGNTRRLAYYGVKLFLNQNGVLAKGFLAGGVKTADYNEIRNLSWIDFCRNDSIPDPNAALFDVFSYDKCVKAWKRLLE